MTKVKYGVATSTPNVDQAAYTSLPRALGYWKQECLDVDVLGFNGSGAVFQAIDAGKIEAGNGPPGPLFVADSHGSQMVAVYDYVPMNFLMPMVPKGSKVKSLTQLAGASIGVANLQAGGVTLIRAIASSAGIAASKLNLIPIGTGANAAQFIKQGKIDVVELWDSAYAQLEQIGINLEPLSAPTFAKIGFYNVVAAKSSYLKDHSDIVAKLARGIAEANLFAHTNPSAAVKLHWREYPASKPTGVSDDKAMQEALAIIKARNAHTGKLAGHQWGYADNQIVQDHMKMLVDAGVIKKAFPVEQIWTGSLLSAANAFDEQAIIQQAKDWKG